MMSHIFERYFAPEYIYSNNFGKLITREENLEYYRSLGTKPTFKVLANTTTAGVARAVLEQLFTGPTSEEKARGFYSDFSEETKSFFLSGNVKNGAAYVNLRDPTLTPVTGNFTTSCGGSNFFDQVSSRLKQFSSIKRVFFAIKGDPSLFYDWMQVGECPKGLKNCAASNFIN